MRGLHVGPVFGSIQLAQRNGVQPGVLERHRSTPTAASDVPSPVSTAAATSGPRPPGSTPEQQQAAKAALDVFAGYVNFVNAGRRNRFGVPLPLEVAQVADGRHGGVPLSVTANWVATWTATTGESGTIPLAATSNTAVDVEEYRIVLVPGG